jgi:hypothetical protein
MKVSLHDLRKIVYWTLLAIVFVYIISGFGILYYQIIETVTLGILTKALSYEIHNYLLIPFLVVLAIHIFLALGKKKGKKIKNKNFLFCCVLCQLSVMRFRRDVWKSPNRVEREV